MMDSDQEQRINEAAEKFANAVAESFQIVSERTVSVQQLNAELTQQFFNGVIQHLRAQAADNQEMLQQLAEQQRRQREATEALTQDSVNAYMEFVNSIFSYYQGRVERVQRQAGWEDAGSGVSPNAETLLENYDSMNVDEVSANLDDLSVEELEQLREYEVQNKNRRTLIERLDLRIKAGS